MMTIVELKLAEVVLSELISDSVQCASEKCSNCKNFEVCNALCRSHQYVQELINREREARYNNEADKSKS